MTYGTLRGNAKRLSNSAGRVVPLTACRCATAAAARYRSRLGEACAVRRRLVFTRAVRGRPLAMPTSNGFEPAS